MGLITNHYCAHQRAGVCIIPGQPFLRTSLTGLALDGLYLWFSVSVPHIRKVLGVEACAVYILPRAVVLVSGSARLSRRITCIKCEG